MNLTEPLPVYLDKQPAHILIVTRSKLLQDETLQISLERILENDDRTHWMPTRLRKQYKAWIKSPAPLAVICNAPLHHQILGTNMALLREDLAVLVKGLSKRRGETKLLATGSDELKNYVTQILPVILDECDLVDVSETI